jgi:hypothetical protein
MKEKGKAKVDEGSILNCNFASTESSNIFIARQIDMENIIFLGKRFRWEKKSSKHTKSCQSSLLYDQGRERGKAKYRQS